MQLLRYIFATILGCLGVWIVVMNWLAICAFVKHKKRFSSVSFLGAFFMIFSILFLPVEKPLWIFLIPLIVDHSCLPQLIYKIYVVLKIRRN